jgi:Neurotransmitter-gated ion-channel ligand binding domain/Neurotransmitter-gated ion-channel transmembrane region
MMWMRSFRRSLAALTALLVIGCLSAFAAEPEPPVRNPFLAPPIVPGQKMDVGVGLHILNIASIDEVAEQFTIDGYLLGQWKDPRLAFTPDPDHPIHVYHPGEIWIPKLEMINSAGSRESYDAVALVSPDGSVNYAERFRSVLSARFQLRRFPFDSQSLPIIIHPFFSAGKIMTLRLRDHHVWAASEFNAYSSLAQWQFEAVTPQTGTARAYDNSEISEVKFEISVMRRSSFYVWKVFVPLLLMVLLSWAVFWIEAGDLSTQVTVAVTTILTVIAFAFAISATMPRVPYLTYIDAFFLQCYVFVFLAMFELMMVHVTHRSDRRRDIGIRFRSVSRIVIPIAFLISNILITVHFLG